MQGYFSRKHLARSRNSRRIWSTNERCQIRQFSLGVPLPRRSIIYARRCSFRQIDGAGPNKGGPCVACRIIIVCMQLLYSDWLVGCGSHHVVRGHAVLAGYWSSSIYSHTHTPIHDTASNQFIAANEQTTRTWAALAAAAPSQNYALQNTKQAIKYVTVSIGLENYEHRARKIIGLYFFFNLCPFADVSCLSAPSTHRVRETLLGHPLWFAAYANKQSQKI
jgi:hypothetical protein